MSFEDCNKSFLRHDPDICLIGETRDRETAQAFAKLANTGHLCFTTLHTNTAKDNIERLLNLGLEEYQIKNAVRLFTCQRLYPRVCQNCNTPDPEGQKLIGMAVGKKIEAFKGEGCDQCNGRGYKGKVLVFEYIKVKSGAYIESENMLERAIRYTNEGLTFASSVLDLADSYKKEVVA